MATEIPLTQGATAIVDVEDAERIAAHRWHLTSAGYAARSLQRGGVKITVLMHREVLYLGPGGEVHHLNEQKLDNRKGNLRPCSQGQNTAARRKAQGQSRFKGVCWMPLFRRWKAEITVNGLQSYLGCFVNEEDAALAYDAAAIVQFGEFARPNFSRPIDARGGPTEGRAR